jgi:hypothetical protein
MMQKTFLALALLALTACASRKASQSSSFPVNEGSMAPDSLLMAILHDNPAWFDTLVLNNRTWRIQVIYTEINRKPNNQPLFINHYFNVNPSLYFYPASTVKMPTAVLALQKLHELKVKGLDRQTMMITDSAYSRQDPVYNDPSTPDGRPTIEQYVRKIFLVSDNDAFNRLYEFLGQEYINNTLHAMGYDSSQVIHRLNISRTEDENRHTNPIKFYDNNSTLVYEQPLVSSQLVYQRRHTLMGTGYYSGDKLVEQPFDFSKKNRFLLQDLHSILQSIIFPEAVPSRKRFNITREDYDLIYRYMSMKPQESDFPSYDTSYPGAYSKLLLYGGQGDMDSSIRIFNKEGDAYGFLTDISYVVDFSNHIEYFLSATISCNSDGIYNDDHYDYDNVGYPFMKHLGEAIYRYELKRKREVVPDLSKFKINYGK